MAPSKFINLVALATIAVFASSFGVEPVNALSGHGPSNPQHRGLGHDSVAKRRRGMQRRQAQPQSDSSSGTNASTSASASASTTDSVSVSNTTASATSASASASSTASNGNGDNNNNGGGSGSGKVCLAWAGGDDPALQNWQTSNSGIIYTWSPWAPGQNTHGYTFAPMLWSEKQIDDFKSQVHEGAPYVMGFNEPELENQATMTPEHGAEVWKQYIQPFAAGGSKLVSPAVVSDPKGKPWLTDFFKACDGCTIDIIALHYYGTSADELISFLTDMHDTFQKPVWLTEYACQNFGEGPQCSPDDIKTFMDKVKQFAESTEWVQQYCWFGATHDMHEVNPNNQLMDGDGKPNALGMDFLGLGQ